MPKETLPSLMSLSAPARPTSPLAKFSRTVIESRFPNTKLPMNWPPSAWCAMTPALTSTSISRCLRRSVRPLRLLSSCWLRSWTLGALTSAAFPVVMLLSWWTRTSRRCGARSTLLSSLAIVNQWALTAFQRPPLSSEMNRRCSAR